MGLIFWIAWAAQLRLLGETFVRDLFAGTRARAYRCHASTQSLLSRAASEFASADRLANRQHRVELLGERRAYHVAPGAFFDIPRKNPGVSPIEFDHRFGELVRLTSKGYSRRGALLNTLVRSVANGSLRRCTRLSAAPRSDVRPKG